MSQLEVYNFTKYVYKAIFALLLLRVGSFLTKQIINTCFKWKNFKTFYYNMHDVIISLKQLSNELNIFKGIQRKNF